MTQAMHLLEKERGMTQAMHLLEKERGMTQAKQLEAECMIQAKQFGNWGHKA